MKVCGFSAFKILLISTTTGEARIMNAISLLELYTFISKSMYWHPNFIRLCLLLYAKGVSCVQYGSRNINRTVHLLWSVCKKLAFPSIRQNEKRPWVCVNVVLFLIIYSPYLLQTFGNGLSYSYTHILMHWTIKMHKLLA